MPDAISPPISLTIVGNAVATIVWSSDASSSTSASAEKIARMATIAGLGSGQAVGINALHVMEAAY